MQSFSALRTTTNPYLKQLVAALEPEVTVRTFSWRAALLGRFDVLHVHWPELLIRSPSRVRTWARRVALLFLLLIVRLRRKALVRTLHNAAPHEPGSVAEGPLLRLFDNWTTVFIALQPTSVPPLPGPVIVIPHGDYREWFAGMPVPEPVPGRIAYVGLVRRYKGLDVLVSAFRALTDADLHLRIVGQAKDAQLAGEIIAACEVDDRVTARLEYVPDADLAAEVGRAGLVALPYRHLENSGAALLALSLNRPILVPDNAVTRALAAEVGRGWVFTFAGELSPRSLLDAVRSAAARPAGAGGPNLTARAWPAIGAAHLTAYQQAVSMAAARGRRSRIEDPAPR